MMKLSFYSLLAGALVPSAQLHATLAIGSVSFSEPDMVASHISSSDLVNAGSPSLLSVSSSPFALIPNVNDGTTNTSLVFEEDSHYPATIVFHLDTTEHTLGYSIDSVVTVTGLSQFESEITPWFLFFSELSVQMFTLSYSLVGEDTYHDLPTISDASRAPIRKVTLIGFDGEIDGGVDALKFTWHDPFPAIAPGTFPDESRTAIREIDVFGSPILPVPEPSVGLLALFGGCLLLNRRNRKNC